MCQRVNVAQGRHFGGAQGGDHQGIFAILAPECSRDLRRLCHAPLRDRAMIELVD